MSELRALSIVIPSYNACDLLRRTLRTLEETAPEAEVIVVDGSSPDGSADMVRREFPAVQLHVHANHGFAHATNRGIERSTRPYVLLLNSDLFVTRDALLAMQERLAKDARLAAVAPSLINEDGTKQQVFGAFYWPNWVDVQKATRVWLVSGACFMTRRDVLSRVGALDESFFLYNEEYDWCTRARRAGYHLEILPHRVVHVGGGSTRRNPALTLEEQRGFLYLATKHAPSFVSEALRRAMQFEGFCYARIDPRPAHRKMWSQLEELTTREAYLDSPFPLSGRGDLPARPNGIELGRVESGRAAPSAEAVVAPVERAPLVSMVVPAPSATRDEGSGAHPLPAEAPSNVRPFRRPARTRSKQATTG